MRVIIDYEICDLNGLCEAIAPEIFQFTPDGELRLVQETPGEELRDKVERAVRSCPKRAISVED